MSYQKMMDDLKRHIDDRFDALEEKLAQSAKPVKQEQSPQSIESLGLPTQQEAALVTAGYTTVAALAAASDEELNAVEGVGKRTVEFIRGRVS